MRTEGKERAFGCGHSINSALPIVMRFSTRRSDAISLRSGK